jgi:branched-chain amino acid transport system permease protein
MPKALPTLFVFAALIAYPMVPGLDAKVVKGISNEFGSILPTLFIFGILGLALNVVLGYAGQLQLGIAAFFGIGAFLAGILRVENYPFQFGFWPTLLVSVVVTMLIGVLLSSPVLRLRGDYLALVTLGFGVITITMLRKFDEITGGKQTLSPIPAPHLPEFLHGPLKALDIQPDWLADYRLFYYMALFFLTLVYFLLWNLERSRLGRAWLAIREDELAATSMGINAARLKLAAFALGAGLAGLAGSLYAIRRSTTLEPTFYDFQLSATILCAVILGGLANRKGVLLGVFFISGFEYLFANIVDGYIQRANINPQGKNYLQFSNWKLMIFGLALILMMRFRPHGILPEEREKKAAKAPASRPA